MAWIESHDNVAEHPKTFRLTNILNIQLQQAVGAVHLLWHFTRKFAQADGNLSRFGDVEIARGCRWEGDPGRFVRALRESRFLCGGGCTSGSCHSVSAEAKTFVHDWPEYSLHYEASLERKERARELVRDRVRRFRLKEKSERKPVGNAVVTRSNADKEPTEPNQTDLFGGAGTPPHTDSAAQESPTKRFQRPTAEQVRAYADSIGFKTLDAERFVLHYEAKGWMIGKTKMKSWKAAVQTWRRIEEEENRERTQAGGRNGSGGGQAPAEQGRSDALRKTSTRIDVP